MLMVKAGESLGATYQTTGHVLSHGLPGRLKVSLKEGATATAIEN